MENEKHLVEYTADNGELSKAIYEDLKTYNHLTLDLFLWACRKNFELHLRNLRKQTVIQYLRLYDYDGEGGFQLLASRYENEEEREKRINQEIEQNKFMAENLKLHFIDCNKYMEKKDILEMKELLDERLKTLESEDTT